MVNTYVSNLAPGSKSQIFKNRKFGFWVFKMGFCGFLMGLMGFWQVFGSLKCNMILKC